jgi:hypothetical protein
MLKLIASLLFFSASLSIYAQPYTACFTMNAQQICVGQSVTFTDCSGSMAGILNTDDGGPIQLDVSVPTNTHTYNTSGVYHPSQIVNDGTSGNSISPTQTLTVVDNTTTPVFTVNSCAGNMVTINVTDTHYDSYEIAWGDGNTSTALPSSSASYTYASTSTYTITVTGKFNSAACVSTPISISVTTLNALIAPVINDLSVNTQQVSGSVTIRFYALPYQQYQIEQQQGGGGYQNIATVQYQSGLQSLTFFNLATSVDPFYYRIYAYDNCGTSPQYSNDIYSVVLSGTYNNNQIDVSWFDYHTFLTSNNFDHYDLYKDGVLIAPDHTSYTYTDLDVNTNQTYAYQIITYFAAGEIAYSAYIPVSTTITATTSALSEETDFSPNPSSDGIFKLKNTEHYDEIVVRSMEGRTVLSRNNVTDSEIFLDLSTANAGMYFVTLKNSEGVKVARLVK